MQFVGSLLPEKKTRIKNANAIRSYLIPIENSKILTISTKSTI